MRWPIVAAMLLLSSCGESQSEFTPGPHQVDYHVSWDTEGVLFSESGFELTNNLGYDIEVTAGYLVFYSTQLVPCEDEESSELTSIDWGKWWGRLIGVRTAHAGHGEEDLDASVVAQSYVEDLTEPVSQQIGSRTIEGIRYCQIHYLVARGGTGTLQLPQEQDMVGTSLYLQGTWEVEGGETQAFTISSSVAYGTLSNLYPSAFYGAADQELQVDASQTGARIEIKRNLLGLFADTDFKAMSDAQLERRILQNVIEYTEFQVDLVP
ncbi:MAG: hypothetical protein HOK97_23005 [Deltaproteobacteria bacterium]|jgi:hypothetical protein|nr:hypothetical protein [Deltaproteobacteria bacterium]